MQQSLLIKFDYQPILVRNGKVLMIQLLLLILKLKHILFNNYINIGHNQKLLVKNLQYMNSQLIYQIQYFNCLFFQVLYLFTQLHICFILFKIINNFKRIQNKYCTYNNLYTEDIFNKTSNNLKVNTQYEIEDLCVWVDPLDGTLDFVQGDYDCVTTLIGLSYKKQALMGIISQPFVKIADQQYEFQPKIYFGHHPQRRVFYTYDTQSLIPFELLKPSYDPSKIILCTQKKRIDGKKLQQIQSLGCPLLQMGGSGKKSITILEGKADLYLYLGVKMSKWDICAPDALIQALGGRFVGLDGQVYEYNHEDKTYDNPHGLLTSIHSELVDQFLPRTTGML